MTKGKAKTTTKTKAATEGGDHRMEPDETGLTAGEKAAATRAMKYGQELHFATGDKKKAVEEYQRQQREKDEQKG